MPEITGVLETSLYVDDVARAAEFYQRLFGFPILVSDDRMCALAASRQVLLLFRKGASAEPMPRPGGVIPPHDGGGALHLAFSIPASEWEPWRDRLAQCGVAIESVVTWERGGRSLYFRDPDRHLVELVTPGCWAIY
ncbi:MAG: VOC family protein [Acidobacteria bacterium]|nr:VOC family protein [Acidobacteriota bacterium]MBI3470517.1 VOC family protein [Candidatus Solibacter usitatus]